MFANVLRYQNSRYLWWSLGLVAVSVILFVTQLGGEPANGGTWQGYTLGTVGALLIVWLSWLGVRKRRYASTSGSVQGWTSAHVYLGTATLFIASLHSALQFGWNVHTLCYVMMCAVIFSGFYGLYVYTNNPRRLSINRMGGSRETLFAELYDLNKRGMQLTRRCDPTAQEAIESSIERTAIGGGVIAQLFGMDSSLMRVAVSNSSAELVANADQQRAINIVADRIPKADKAGEVVPLRDLLSVLCRRQTIIRRLRKDIQLQAWLQVWLYVHVPLTIALLFALVIHIVTTFIYW